MKHPAPSSLGIVIHSARFAFPVWLVSWIILRAVEFLSPGFVNLYLDERLVLVVIGLTGAIAWADRLPGAVKHQPKLTVRDLLFFGLMTITAYLVFKRLFVSAGEVQMILTLSATLLVAIISGLVLFVPEHDDSQP